MAIQAFPNIPRFSRNPPQRRFLNVQRINHSEGLFLLTFRTTADRSPTFTPFKGHDLTLCGPGHYRGLTTTPTIQGISYSLSKISIIQLIEAIPRDEALPFALQRWLQTLNCALARTLKTDESQGNFLDPQRVGQTFCEQAAKQNQPSFKFTFPTPDQDLNISMTLPEWQGEPLDLEKTTGDLLWHQLPRKPRINRTCLQIEITPDRKDFLVERRAMQIMGRSGNKIRDYLAMLVTS